jgi:hypothetical protein
MRSGHRSRRRPRPAPISARRVRRGHVSGSRCWRGRDRRRALGRPCAGWRSCRRQGRRWRRRMPWSGPARWPRLGSRRRGLLLRRRYPGQARDGQGGYEQADEARQPGRGRWVLEQRSDRRSGLGRFEVALDAGQVVVGEVVLRQRGAGIGPHVLPEAGIGTQASQDVVDVSHSRSRRHPTTTRSSRREYRYSESGGFGTESVRELVSAGDAQLHVRAL